MHRLNRIALDSPAYSEPHIIQIAGHNRFMSELLAQYMVNDSHLRCRRLPADALKGAYPDDLDACLVILDASDINLGRQWEAAKARCSLPSRNNLFILYNVDPHAGIDSEALRLGIRGLFYRTETPETIGKAITKILEGEIWYRRETLFNCIADVGLGVSLPQRTKAAGKVHLTQRERRILHHLSRGASNQDIADQMVVSVHTVKSHLYKIYRKINVPNRLQATLWATSHLVDH